MPVCPAQRVPADLGSTEVGVAWRLHCAITAAHIQHILGIFLNAAVQPAHAQDLADAQPNHAASLGVADCAADRRADCAADRRADAVSITGTHHATRAWSDSQPVTDAVARAVSEVHTGLSELSQLPNAMRCACCVLCAGPARDRPLLLCLSECFQRSRSRF